MDRRLRYIILFAIGAVAYSVIEVLWRGYTHLTMSAAGGLVFVILYRIERSRRFAFVPRCLIGAAVITLTELIFGLFFNVLLGMRIWDYSDRHFDLMGQICLDYSVLWFLLCIPAYYLCGVIERLWSDGGDMKA